ncbi:MAG: DNA gyrase subunit A [Chlamydiae bacterium]|nr:DNA gyrase subunit A [Chlamydiota bacterium]MBI3276282.1 DNA gyrase subunit A [Chlamydiota bacterium]
MAEETKNLFTRNEKIVPISIEEEVRNSYMDYSMSVIVGRALPDCRDGLKPVHRRILYAMRDLGLVHNREYKKSARIVGEVLGKYHPHGDLSVYDALVRMVQTFSLRYPLVDGQGNFGSVDGDNAAAMRYTEVRLTALAEEMLEDIDKETVDFRPNFDESLEEPVLLPSKIPNLILNGSSGIAVGMATNIPPHNLKEVCGAIKHLIDDPQATIKDLIKLIPGPDFPTGAIICGRQGVLDMYNTGRGHIKTRARAGVEEIKNGKTNIVVTEIPYTVNKASLLEKIAELVNDKKITGISDIRDESDKDGMRIVLELKRGENEQVVLNQLYKHTQMQETFGAILLAIDQGMPKVLNLKQLLGRHIDHRKVIITRRTTYELRIAEERAHILEGFKIALDHIDQVVKTIREAKDRKDAFEKLMKKFALSDRQATAILDMRLYQLTGLERTKIEEEYLEVIKRISYLKGILASEKKVLALIKDELTELYEKYGDDRRTTFQDDEKEFHIEDLIADESTIITVSHSGYIKRTSPNLYRQQRRGGKGIMGMEMRDEDFVEDLYTASTLDYLLFITETGHLYWLKVYEIPQAGRLSKGKAIVNLLDMDPGEKLATIIRVRDFDQPLSVVMATQQGTVKKTPLKAFSNPRKGGIIAMTVDSKDRLVSARLTQAEDDVILATHFGQSIRFHSSQIRDMGRTAQGVRGIRLGKNDYVVAMEAVQKDATLLIVTENGYGKRTAFDEYRIQGRGGSGIITVKTKDRNGPVVGGLSVVDKDEVMIITATGKMIRSPVSGISVIGRNTQGVRLINLAEKDKVVAICKVIESEEGEEGETSDAGS